MIRQIETLKRIAGGVVMNNADATHTDEKGKSLYRIVCSEKDMSYMRIIFRLKTGVQFWDVHCNKWRSSIVRQKHLIKLENQHVTNKTR
jgi:hypothetical protein